MKTLLTVLVMFIFVEANEAYSAELHKVIRMADPVDSLTIKTQVEDIIISALKKRTTSVSVELSNEISSANADENISDVSQESKTAVTTKHLPTIDPSKQPAVSAAPIASRSTIRPNFTWPTSTTKQPRPTTSTRRPRPDLDPNTPVDCKSDTELWPHPYCNKYIWCINGEKTIHTCNDGLYWNYKLERCGWPNRVPKDHCKIPQAVVYVTTLTTTTPVLYRDYSENDFPLSS